MNGDALDGRMHFSALLAVTELHWHAKQARDAVAMVTGNSMRTGALHLVCLMASDLLREMAAECAAGAVEADLGPDPQTPAEIEATVRQLLLTAQAATRVGLPESRALEQRAEALGARVRRLAESAEDSDLRTAAREAVEQVDAWLAARAREAKERP